MKKKLMEFNSTSSLTTITISSSDWLTPWELNSIIDQIMAVGGEITFIDADSLRAKISLDDYNSGIDVMKRLMLSGWEFTE